MKKTILFFIVIIFSACSVKLIAPTESDVARVISKYPNYSLTQLQKGKSDYEKYCTQCHGLKRPSSKTEEKWDKIVPWMCKKNNEKPNLHHISDETQASILKYVITMSSAK